MRTRRNLGPVQKMLLKDLRDHAGGEWRAGCGWHYGGFHNTAKVLESMIDPWGYVEKIGDAPMLGERSYRITAAGRAELSRLGK